MPSPRLPETVKILHRTYTLTERTMKEQATSPGIAHIDTLSGEIKYMHTDATDTVDSVLHEVLHGLWYMFDLDGDQEVEEHVVKVLATGLTCVMKDNPVLFRKLQAMLA